MHVLLAVLLAAQAVEGLTFEKPKDWLRQDDPAGGWTAFRPPNLAAGVECAVVVLPARLYGGTAQEFHDEIVRAFFQGERVGETRTAAVGVFQVTAITQKTPQGLHYAAAHTARWGDRAQAVLYGTLDPRLFGTHAPTVLAMIGKVTLPAAAQPPAAGPVGGLLMPMPPGWTRQDDPASGWIFFTPPANLANRDPRLMVLPARKIQGTHWATHRALLKDLMDARKWPADDRRIEVWTFSPGPFVCADATRNAGPWNDRQIRVFSAVAGDRMEAVVLQPVGDDGFLRAVLGILERTTLKDGVAPKRPKVVEAYRRPARKNYVNLNGTITYGRLMYERMFLFENGVTDHSASYDEGLGASTLIPKLDADTLGSVYGRWTSDDKTVRILREPGQAERVYQRENGNLRFGDQEWTPIPRVDGLRLKGRYAWKTETTNAWADFSEDGTFKTGGLLTWLAVSDVNGRPKPPETATGTYEIRDWTIFFQVNGAVVWSTDFMTLKDDPKDLGIILLQTFGVPRE